MLSSGPVCDETLIGGGVLGAMRPGSLLIVMSSIPVATAQSQAELAAERGIDYLDAPVSGGETGAREGTLAIMAGGAQDVFERARPLLEVMGRPTHIGPAGTGQLSKLVNQMIVASTTVTVAEAMLLAERGGADPAKVREALLGGFANSTILRQHALRMIRTRFQAGRASQVSGQGHDNGRGVRAKRLVLSCRSCKSWIGYLGTWSSMGMATWITARLLVRSVGETGSGSPRRCGSRRLSGSSSIS